jgi:hypothetical protein
MFTSIAYKEWLKIRWTYLAMIAVLLGVIITILLDLRHLMTMERPTNVWSYIILMQYPFYGPMRYIPLLVGCAIAVAQFVPEVVQSRLKLSLHLPLGENRVLLWMVAYGAVVVAALFIVAALALIAIALRTFPLEVTWSMVLTMAPWYLAGMTGYFLTAIVVVEPRWVRRAIYLIIGYLFVDALLLNNGIEAHTHSLLSFKLLWACTVIGITLSGLRFRKGVR